MWIIYLGDNTEIFAFDPWACRQINRLLSRQAAVSAVESLLTYQHLEIGLRTECLSKVETQRGDSS